MYINTCPLMDRLLPWSNKARCTLYPSPCSQMISTMTGPLFSVGKGSVMRPDLINDNQKIDWLFDGCLYGICYSSLFSHTIPTVKHFFRWRLTLSHHRTKCSTWGCKNVLTNWLIHGLFMNRLQEKYLTVRDCCVLRIFTRTKYFCTSMMMFGL